MRQTNFTDNTTQMIDSILKRNIQPITFDNIIISDNIITNSSKIKNYVKTHFKNWTQHNPPNLDLQEE